MYDQNEGELCECVQDFRLKMSPEPTHEPVDNLNTSNINIGMITAHESDSEDEDAELAGYIPLSEIPIDGEPSEDDSEEEFEWNSGHSEFQQVETVSNSEGESSIAPETLEIWSSRSNASNIHLDADKINEVKSAMASFTLPSTAIPEWANSISEDQWKEQLIHRIKEIQNDKK